jgi:hypothetical protein
LFGFLLITSCDFSSLDDPIVIPEVEDEFTVDLWENLGATSEERNLIVKIESVKKEKCLNYRIDHQFIRNDNRLKIALNSLIQPSDCVAGEATVKADVNAGYLKNGIYLFNIDLKNTVFNDGQLTVLGDSYTLKMQSENGFSLRHKELLRVPDGAVWGYVQYRQAADEAAANKFLEELKSIGQNPTWYRVGYYGHFSLNHSDRKVTVFEQPSTSPLKTFLYQYTDEPGKLNNLLNTYRQTYGNRLTIKLYNAKGEVF